MNPRKRGFGLMLGLAAMCGEFSREFGGTLNPAPTPSFTPRTAEETRAESRATFTPQMRELVAEEMARLKAERPDLNSKERKKLARKAVLQAAI